ncbi:GNAT family N-acetyltransferase [Bacillus sp. 1P06AnD]|uniref:GNAT family N-acetyltransferase n=1 Tax=Bacillus sp. 1P06AnD TaxID=3132208 RepID=UPI0039A0BDA2
MENEFKIKSLTTLPELEQVQQLEQLVWGMGAIPTHQTLTAVKNGGLVLGGFKDGELVGFQYSFPGFRNGEPYLCSHMLAIHPNHQKKGYGRLLKQAQKEEALKKGYRLITWTYDPLESVNATLNIGKLKAICRTYMEDCYGKLEGLNAGLATDRFLVEWEIGKKEQRIHVNEAHAYKAAEVGDKAGFPEITHVELNEDFETVLVPIPTAFQQIKKEEPQLAIDWRMKTRAIFQFLFRKGYMIVDVDRSREEGLLYYILGKQTNNGGMEDED